MNERIEKLLAHTDIPKFPILGSPAWVATDHDMEKFAELIVRECMMLCGAVSGAAEIARPNDAFGKGAEKCQGLIKEHFGVEE